jgi:hypothetical protein
LAKKYRERKDKPILQKKRGEKDKRKKTKT